MKTRYMQNNQKNCATEDRHVIMNRENCNYFMDCGIKATGISCILILLLWLSGQLQLLSMEL